MSGTQWTTNSLSTLKAYIANVEALFAEHKYLTFPAPRIGADRSISQNSIWHVWLTEYAAHLARIDKRDVTKGMLAGMKRATKGRYYAHSSQSFMIHTIIDPKTQRSRNDYTSSKDWKRGEMFAVLEWLQFEAANDGLILESKGEFAKLKRDQDNC